MHWPYPMTIWTILHEHKSLLPPLGKDRSAGVARATELSHIVSKLGKQGRSDRPQKRIPWLEFWVGRNRELHGLNSKNRNLWFATGRQRKKKQMPPGSIPPPAPRSLWSNFSLPGLAISVKIIQMIHRVYCRREVEGITEWSGHPQGREGTDVKGTIGWHIPGQPWHCL